MVLVRQALKEASGMGLNVMRVFAHTTDPNFPMQTSAGVYNEKVLKALDFVMVEVSPPLFLFPPPSPPPHTSCLHSLSLSYIPGNFIHTIASFNYDGIAKCAPR